MDGGGGKMFPIVNPSASLTLDHESLKPQVRKTAAMKGLHVSLDEEVCVHAARRELGTCVDL